MAVWVNNNCPYLGWPPFTGTKANFFPISTPRNTAQHTYSVLPLSHLIPANLIASSATKCLSSSALSTIPEQNKSERFLRFLFYCNIILLGSSFNDNSASSPGVFAWTPIFITWYSYIVPQYQIILLNNDWNQDIWNLNQNHKHLSYTVGCCKYWPTGSKRYYLARAASGLWMIPLILMYR